MRMRSLTCASTTSFRFLGSFHSQAKRLRPKSNLRSTKMAEPFLGEIRIMSFNYAPREWAQCNGQFLPINQNQALFSLLGTTYGGNGQTTFALPDLRSRVAMHEGQ